MDNKQALSDKVVPLRSHGQLMALFNPIKFDSGIESVLRDAKNYMKAKEIKYWEKASQTLNGLQKPFEILYTPFLKENGKYEFFQIILTNLPLFSMALDRVLEESGDLALLSLETYAETLRCLNTAYNARLFLQNL